MFSFAEVYFFLSKFKFPWYTNTFGSGLQPEKPTGNYEIIALPLKWAMI